MRLITISRASHELLAAHSKTGNVLGGVELPDGRLQIVVDEDVFSALSAIDADPDRAISQLCGSGVGHA